MTTALLAAQAFVVCAVVAAAFALTTHLWFTGKPPVIAAIWQFLIGEAALLTVWFVASLIGSLVIVALDIPETVVEGDASVFLALAPVAALAVLAIRLALLSRRKETRP